jgi:hypothetical protein
VYFTSYERWMHYAANGEFEYPKSIDEYIAEVKQSIAKNINDDTTGQFDVIKFLKKWRGDNPVALWKGSSSLISDKFCS